ncbi:uncharacterized protein LOC116823933 isoform X2 [Chelonoidis abingdonii]|uniref:uncharacterized protein LOC116823933 isoform X2 n=1 Tax=Chelonoidis abingdonii TaxID=106734 RepID=UPI003F4952DB
MQAASSWERSSRAASPWPSPTATCRGRAGPSLAVRLAAPSGSAPSTWTLWPLVSTRSSSPTPTASATSCAARPGSSEPRAPCTGVQEAFQDMQEAASRQRLAFAEIVNHLSFLHRFLVGESQALGSFLYHLLTGSTALLLTCSQRTAGARLILLGLVGGNVYLERVVSGLVLENTEAGSDPTEALASWVGLCRRLCAGAGLAVLAYCVLTYRDVAQQSREVLRGLQETWAQMQHILQETERLLAQRGPDPSQVSANFADSGFPEPLSQLEQGAPSADELNTSSPRSLSRSPARQSARPQRRPGRQDSETHNIPVPLDGLCCYDLRRRPSLQGLSQTPAAMKGPLSRTRRGRAQSPAAGAILPSPTWDRIPTV